MGLLNDNKGPVHTPIEVHNVQLINVVTFDLGRCRVKGEALEARKGSLQDYSSNVGHYSRVCLRLLLVSASSPMHSLRMG
jgi:hypothetical protein